jgi:xylulokinase
MLDLCGLSHDQVPKVYESYERVGTLLVDIADELGLSHEVVVIAGAGDNAAAAIGCGVVDEGQCNISIGTSGTLFVPSNSFRVDKRNSLHSFADATGGYHLMGCILSAASAYSWWVQDVLGSDGLSPRDRGLDGIELGTNPVLFLPYLMGERSPVNDALARGAFVGMSLSTSQAQMTLAVMEGVAFALRDSFECARGMGIEINRVTMCGGGAKNPIWRKVIADVLDEPVCLLRREEGPGFGACILAMVGCGLFPNVASAARRFNGVEKTIEPDVTEAVAYKRMYARYGRLYPALKELFHLPEAELS